MTRRCFPTRLVVRDVQVVELGAVVVADEAAAAENARGSNSTPVDGAEAVRLLPARDERLAKLAADGLAAVQPQVAGPRGQAEQLLRPRRAQPLEVDRQSVGVEVLAIRRRAETGALAARGAGASSRGSAVAVERAQPAVRPTRPSAGSRSRGRACSGRDCAAAGRRDRPCRSRRLRLDEIGVPARCSAASGRWRAVRM